MFPGETIRTGAAPSCATCEVKPQLEVLSSGGGYYIGTSCACGPYSRETGYYKNRQEAEAVLATCDPDPTKNPDHPAMRS